MKNLIAVSSFALLALVAFAATPASAALVVDDFEVGPYSVTDTPGSPTSNEAEQSGLSTSNVIGGVRRTTTSATFDDATATVVSTGGDDSVLFSSGDNASMNLYYDGTAGSNVRALGADLTGFASIRVRTGLNPSGSASLQAFLYDSSTFEFSSVTAVPNGSGVVEFILGDFASVDLSDIQQIRLVAFLNGGGSLGLRDIVVAVPEPGTALLLGAGLFGLALRRRN